MIHTNQSNFYDNFHDNCVDTTQAPPHVTTHKPLHVAAQVPRQVEGVYDNFFAGTQDGSTKSVRIGSTLLMVLLKKLRRETIFSLLSIILILWP